MKIMYECEHCHTQFADREVCELHEFAHLNGINRIRYWIMNILHRRPCKYCSNVYYVYGCEENCKYPDCHYSNGYRDFKPSENIYEKLKEEGMPNDI